MPEPDDDTPRIDPETDAEVSALLRSLRQEGGVPDEVAVRLDARLADLTADLTAVGSRERRAPWVRRHAGRLLVAAAVVVVGGVGGTVVRSSLGSGGSGSGSSSSTDAAAGSARTDLPQSLPVLTSARFATQARALLERSDLSATGEATAPTCGAPPVAPGVQRRAIVLDGRPAVLDIHPARGDTVLVRALGCGGGRVLATARVPRD